MSKNFIFDWSGTLSDNVSHVHEVCDLMFRDLGGEPLTMEEMRKNFTVPYMRFWNKYFPDITKERQDELYKKYIHTVGRPGLYAGAAETIAYLHENGNKLFLVSSDWHSTLLPEVKESGLKDFFSEVIGEAYDKTNTFLSLLEKYSLPSKETYYIGDTDGDIEYGKSSGIKTIGISWGLQHRDILAKAKPDFLIGDISEMKEIF